MDLQAEIRDEVALYLSGRLPISMLWGWAQERFWDVDSREDPGQARLAHEVGLLLSETANGDWTEDELREKLRRVVSVYEFSFGRPSSARTAAGTTRTIVIPSSRALQSA